MPYPQVIDVAVLPVVPGSSLIGVWRINPYSRTMECVLEESEASTCRAFSSQSACTFAIDVWSRDARFSGSTSRCPQQPSSASLTFKDATSGNQGAVGCSGAGQSLGCSDVSKPLGVDVEQRKMSYFAGVDIGAVSRVVVSRQLVVASFPQRLSARTLTGVLIDGRKPPLRTRHVYVFKETHDRGM